MSTTHALLPSLAEFRAQTQHVYMTLATRVTVLVGKGEMLFPIKLRTAQGASALTCLQ